MMKFNAEQLVELREAFAAVMEERGWPVEKVEVEDHPGWPAYVYFYKDVPSGEKYAITLGTDARTGEFVIISVKHGAQDDDPFIRHLNADSMTEALEIVTKTAKGIPGLRVVK